MRSGGWEMLGRPWVHLKNIESDLEEEAGNLAP